MSWARAYASPHPVVVVMAKRRVAAGALHSSGGVCLRKQHPFTEEVLRRRGQANE